MLDTDTKIQVRCKLDTDARINTCKNKTVIIQVRYGCNNRICNNRICKNRICKNRICKNRICKNKC